MSKEFNFADAVNKELALIGDMLKEKNIKYGNSALEPKRVFSKASPVEQILVRIDDKISRLTNQNIADDEDVVKDLIGYLIILRIAQQNKENTSESAIKKPLPINEPFQKPPPFPLNISSKDGSIHNDLNKINESIIDKLKEPFTISEGISIQVAYEKNIK